MDSLLFIAQILVLVYFFAINSVYSLLTFMSFIEVHDQARRTFIDDYANMLRSRIVPGLSILVPCFNEEEVIADNVHSLLTSKYPKIELVVINDGSTDDTLGTLIREFKLDPVKRVIRGKIETCQISSIYKSGVDPRLIVVDKENGGKADSLNVGLNASHMPYVLTIDADVVLDDQSLLRIMKPIVDDPEHTVAGGGIVRIVNECEVSGGQVVQARLPRKPLILFQIVEYMRAFTAGRAGFAKLNSLMIISGAFGVFNADILRHIGGFYRQTVGEDLEVMVRLHRVMRREGRKYNVFYAAFPICWTEAPSTLRSLGRQRSRWHRGLSEALWRHKSMVFNPRYGRIGMFAVPVFFLFEWWGPLLEALGYFMFIFFIVTGRLDTWFFMSFLSIAILWGMLLSVTSVAMQDIEFRWLSRWRSLQRLITYALLENLGYKQITVFWRIRGLFAWVFRRKAWGTMPRTGFSEPEPESPLQKKG